MLATKIMLVLGERAWTNEALHLACAAARRQNATINLIKMIPVVHPQMLGTTAGYLQFTSQDEQDIEAYTATAEEYNVVFTIQFCQYTSYLHGVVDAAQQLGVSDVVIYMPTHMPFGRVIGWHQLQERWLRWQLHHHHQQLHTLARNNNTLEWTPTLVLNHPSY